MLFLVAVPGTQTKRPRWRAMLTIMHMRSSQLYAKLPTP